MSRQQKLSELNLEDLTVLHTPELIEPFRPLEENQLNALPSYDYFSKLTEEGYQQYLNCGLTLDNRPYQWQYAALMCCRHFNIMGYDMSVGKSICSLLCVYGLRRDSFLSGNIKRGAIHIVVPSLLAAERWLEELSRMSIFTGHYKVLRTEKDLVDVKEAILIYSHDYPKRVSKIRAHKDSRVKHLSKYLANLKPSMLIIDEVHGLKSNTSRTKHLTAIRDKSKRVLALTGTPTESCLKQLHTLFNFIYKDLWPYTSYKSFSKQYGRKEKIKANYLQGTNVQGEGPDKYLLTLDPKQLSSYYDLMRRFIHRVQITEPQILPYITLPRQEFITHEVLVEPQRRQIYQDYINEHKSALRQASLGQTGRHMAEALQLISPLIKFSNYPLNIEGIDSKTNKVKKVVEVVGEAKGKVVVFCERVDSAWLVTEALKEAYPDQVVRLYAKDIREEPPVLDNDKRVEIVDSFQYSKNIKVGVFSISLAGQAIDLTKASDVIYYCLPWSSVKIVQSISRVVRSGNPYKVVNLHYLYQKGLIDDYQIRLAIEKIKGSNLMLNYDMGSGYPTTSDLSPAELLSLMLEDS